MSWEPQINVFDPRPIKDNLIAWFTASQADALLWANGGEALPPLLDFHKNIRPVTRFPALTFLDAAHATEFEDIISIRLSMLLQVAVVHGDQDELDRRASRYAMALESMLLNTPKTTFNTDSILTVNAETARLATAFDVQGRLPNNRFIQVFETTIEWGLTGQARN